MSEPRPPIRGPEDIPDVGTVAQGGLVKGRAKRSAASLFRAFGVALLLLVGFEGTTLRDSVEKLQPGWRKETLARVLAPVGWVSEHLPFHSIGERFNFVIGGEETPEAKAVAPAPRSSLSPRERAHPEHRPAATTPERAVALSEIDPTMVPGNVTALPLRTILLTGDSLIMPLDRQLGRRLAGKPIELKVDAHIGTALSDALMFDWQKVATAQVERHAPDLVIVALGGNEGGISIATDDGWERCCGPAWTALYATRARRLMTTYAQQGHAHVIWMLVPSVRDAHLSEIARLVNHGAEVAAAPMRDHVHFLDTGDVLSPGGKYTDALTLGGRPTLVRSADGKHISDDGAALVADALLTQIRLIYALP